MYLDSMAHYYDMSTPVGLPDLGVVGGNPGTGANIVGNPEGMPGGRCAEFNGNNSAYTLGDVVELNAVSAFSIALWLNQDVIDQIDTIFAKGASNEFHVTTHSTGPMYLQPNGIVNRGYFDYSTVINAGQWHHLVVVFNGAGTGNVGRLQCYVDATPVALSYDGTIAATTADTSGDDALIGARAGPVRAFDGKLDSFGIFTDPLTQLQVTDVYNRTRRGAL